MKARLLGCLIYSSPFLLLSLSLSAYEGGGALLRNLSALCIQVGKERETKELMKTTYFLSLFLSLPLLAVCR